MKKTRHCPAHTFFLLTFLFSHFSTVVVLLVTTDAILFLTNKNLTKRLTNLCCNTKLCAHLLYPYSKCGTFRQICRKNTLPNHYVSCPLCCSLDSVLNIGSVTKPSMLYSGPSGDYTLIFLHVMYIIKI